MDAQAINEVGYVDINDESDLIDCSNLDPISSILSSYGPEVEKTINAFKKQCITYSNLSSLNANDLELLEIKNKKHQEEMLKDFASLPKQDDHFEKYLRELDLEDYEDNLIQNIEIHMSDMKTLLTATHLKLSINPTEDVLVNENKFSTELILNIIDQMGAYSNQMSNTLQLLKNEESLKKTYQRDQKSKNYIKMFTGAGILSIGGFMLTKFLKRKFF